MGDDLITKLIRERDEAERERDEWHELARRQGEIAAKRERERDEAREEVRQLLKAIRSHAVSVRGVGIYAKRRYPWLESEAEDV